MACVFDKGECSALNAKLCDNCNFFKDADEYYLDEQMFACRRNNEEHQDSDTSPNE